MRKKDDEEKQDLKRQLYKKCSEIWILFHKNVVNLRMILQQKKQLLKRETYLTLLVPAGGLAEPPY